MNLIRRQVHYTDRKMYRRSTSKKRAAEAEREARMEEKEATSAEDVEEILLEIEDRQPEPAEEVQQPEGEPEVIQQETQPEVKQPETPNQTGEEAFQEWMRRMMESLKEDNQSLNKKMDETSRSTKEELSKKIEEGQKESQKNMELLKDCLLYTSLDEIFSGYPFI